jgi:hypothetical protein
MMSIKLLASLALTVGFTNISIASDITKFPTEMVCATEKALGSVLDEFGEIPFATMMSMREIPVLGVTANSMVMFVNPKTKSYTIVERIGKDLYCVVALGENIEPYREEK